jgi:hypothetical protein
MPYMARGSFDDRDRFVGAERIRDPRRRPARMSRSSWGFVTAVVV